MYEARVVHHIPGRMRIKAPFLKGAASYSEQVNELLLPLEGLKQVDFSAITGSILLHYDPKLYDQFAEQLAQYIQHSMGLKLLPATTNLPSNSRDDSHAILPTMGDTALTREIYSWFNRINDDVRSATDDFLDLKSLLPISLGLYALLRAGSTAATPLWVTLGIFSFTSFAILNPVSIKVGSEEKQIKSSRGGKGK